MNSQTKFKLVMVCLLLISLIFVACDRKAIDENKEETEVIFSEGVIPIKMTFANGWSTITSFYSSHKSSEYLSTIKHTPSVHIDNSLKERVDGDRALSMDLMYPYYINNKDIKTFIPNIDTKTKGKYGKNYIYISNPPENGFVLVDNKFLLRIEIEHWPKNGMKPEIESFFSSLHID